jgi:hypothetical protein
MLANPAMDIADAVDRRARRTVKTLTFDRERRIRLRSPAPCNDNK